jgi:hypothetical protein
MWRKLLRGSDAVAVLMAMVRAACGCRCVHRPAHPPENAAQSTL